MVASTDTPSVLIADAEPYICRVFEAKLTKDSQFVVVSVSSHSDAIRAALSQTFDILLWDIRLRDTHTSLPHLRALCPNALLILTTTDDRPILDANISRLDISDILVKPLGLDTLVTRIGQSLRAPCMTVPVGRVDLASVGQQLSIVTPGGECITRVLETGQDHFTVVGAPRVATPEDFVLGQPVRVRVKGEDALYSFSSRLLRNRLQPVEQWELLMPRSIRREQRRKYPRQPLRLNLAFHELTEPVQRQRNVTEDFANVATPLIKAVTDDISLGGIALTCDCYLPVGTEVGFSLESGEYHITGNAVVVRAGLWESHNHQTPLPESDLQYRIALQFKRLDSLGRRNLQALLEPRR